MGLTKQYLRYVASAVFGVIGSQKANLAYVTLRGGERGRYIAAAACEHVFIWDVRKGEKARSSALRPRHQSPFQMLANLPRPCAGDDPGGSEARGDLPPPLTRRRQHCGGLRGRRRADIQPIERREQRFLQWPQVCRQRHMLR